MSGENVEKARALIDAFNARDVQAVSGLFAPDIEIVPIRAALEDTVYAGPDAAAQWFAAVDGSWESLTAEVDSLQAVGGDRVVGVGRVRGAGRESGVTIDAEAACVAQFRDGLIAKLRLSTDVAGTLEAAGLSE